MTYMLVSSNLDDFDTWKAEFDANTPKREEYGSTGYEVYRSTDDENRTVVVLAFDDLDSARAWNDYVKSEFANPDTGMADTTVEFLELVDRKSSETVSA